eukprot:4264263-Pyramimonas_sp.AAC.1
MSFRHLVLGPLRNPRFLTDFRMCARRRARAHFVSCVARGSGKRMIAFAEVGRGGDAGLSGD